MILSYKPAESQGETSTLAVKAVVFDGEFHELADVVAERVVHSTGCEPSRAELRAVLDSSRRTRDENGVVTVSEFRLENAINPDELSLGLDDPVIIGVRLDDERVLVIFRGRVTHIGAALSESDESVTLTALDARRMFDTRELRGMTFASPAGGTASTDCKLVFNPDGVGNLDAVNSFAGNTSAPLFGDPSAPASEKDESFAGYWRLVDFCR